MKKGRSTPAMVIVVAFVTLAFTVSVSLKHNTQWTVFLMDSLDFAKD